LEPVGNRINYIKAICNPVRPFSVKYLGGREMVSTSDAFWPIDRSETRKIWTKVVPMREKMRFIHTNNSHENIRASSYIVSLVKHFIVGQAKVE
jgi:hypothetical protein